MKWYHYRGNVIEEQPSPSSDQPATNAAPAPPQATVIPGVDSLLGDLLDMDLGGPSMQQQQVMQQPQSQTPQPSGGMDLLGEGLDSLVSNNHRPPNPQGAWISLGRCSIPW